MQCSSFVSPHENSGFKSGSSGQNAKCCNYWDNNIGRMSEQTESIILHTNHDSSPTWRVRIALALKGVTFERKFHKFDQLQSTEYTKVNPLGQIPALEIDGEIFTQSLAIIDYLDEKYPEPKLLPTDLKKRAKARQIAEIINSGIYWMTIFIELV